MAAEVAPVVLGIDLDGVCVDTYERLRLVAAEWFERDADSLTPWVSFGLSEWGVRSPQEHADLLRFAVTQRDLFGSAPPMPGARRVLRRLAQEGHRVRIIARRLALASEPSLAARQTLAWLDLHAIPYADVCFTDGSTDVGADIYVDDAPDEIARLRGAGRYAICFGNSTNEHVTSPRAMGWDEVYGFVRERARAAGEAR